MSHIRVIYIHTYLYITSIMNRDNNYSCCDMAVITQIIGSCNICSNNKKCSSNHVCKRDEWCECLLVLMSVWC